MIRGLRILIPAVCLFAASSQVMAQTPTQAEEAFKQGLQARGDRKWPDVARHMRTAIQRDPQESTRKIRQGIGGILGQGMEYLPHYFLGEALKNQQDCAGAVTEWALSEQQKAVQSKPEFVAVIRKGFQECAGRGVLLPNEFNALLSSSRQAYVDASAVAKRVTELGAAHRDVWATFSQQYDRAHSELETASTRLQAGMRTRSASDFNEVKAASERANALLGPLESSLNAAIESVASIQQKIRDVEQAITGADAADRAIDSVKLTLSDQMEASRKAGRDQLTQARDRATVGQKTQNATVVSEALKYAQTATSTFNQVLEQLRKVQKTVIDQELGNAVRIADEAFASVSALMATLDRRTTQNPAVVTPQIASQRESLQKQIETQRRRFERARKGGDLAGLADVTRQTNDAKSALDTLIQTFGPLTLRDRGVHAALEDGARRFLEGDYQNALTALEPAVGVSDVPLMLHVHLFRAASFFALFNLSGDTNAQLRTRALEEIARCKELDSSFRPDTRVFSPRFLAVYHVGGTTNSSAAAPATQ